MEKKVTTHIVKGLIISLILIVFDLIGGFAAFKFQGWYRWTTSGLLVVAVIWACINYGMQKNQNVTFGELFSHGFKTSAVVACVMVLFSIVSLLLLFPETKEQALDMARKQMEQKGNLTEDMIDRSMDITRKMFIPFAIIGVIIGTLVVGLIGSLIGAAVTKKNPQAEFENQFKS